MRKTLLRIGIFCMGLLIGIQAAVLDLSIAEHVIPREKFELPEIHENHPLAKLPDGIQISYVGLTPKDSEFGPTMQFLIYNASSERITCIGYEGVCASPEILIKGQDAKAWVCMNGSSKYSIRPGTAAFLMVGPYDFAKLPKKSERVSIGYKVKRSDGTTASFFAEPMPLPPGFRDQIRDYLRENGSY